MAQELDLIIELLKEIKRASDSNTTGFDRTLNNITSRLDVMERTSVSSDLLKIYLGELAKNLDEKYTVAQQRFSDIEAALKILFNEQDGHVKNKDVKELFDIFTQNMNSFYTEARQQKAIISGIEARIADMSADKSDKEDILRTITLLRNDFENLNHSYKNAIDNLNSDLKSILSSLIKLDTSEITLHMSEKLDAVSKAAGDIASYLGLQEKRNEVFEKLLSNTATNESLKFTHGVLDLIVEKSVEISDKISTLADKSDVENICDQASLMHKRMDEAVTKELFSQVTKTAESLVTQSEEIKQTLANVTKTMDTLPDTRLLEDAVQNLFKKIGTLDENLSNLKPNDNMPEIEEKISVLKDELSVVKSIITDIHEVLSGKILSAIDEISFKEDSYDIKNHISSMLSQLPQREDIDNILRDYESNREFMEEVLRRADVIEDRLDSLPTHQDLETLNSNQLSLIENLQDVANKADIERLEAKADDLEEMLDNLNFDDEFENIYDKTTSIEDWLVNSKIKEKSDEILSMFPEKAAQKEVEEVLEVTKRIAQTLEELSHNTDAKKVNRTVSEVYSMIEDLKNDFVNTTEMHNDSVIVALSELQNVVSNLVTVEDFNNLTDDLRAFSEKNINDTDTIGAAIAEIKEILNSGSKNFVNNQVTDEQKIQEYIAQVQEAAGGVSEALAGNINSKLSNLENKITNYNINNQNLISQIVSKVEGLEGILTSSNPLKDLNSSVKDVERLNSQFKTLGASFEALSRGTVSEDGSGAAEFVSSKLNEISNDLASYFEDIEQKLQQGFSFNSEVVEEKVSMLLDLIRELKTSGSSNTEFCKKLESADNVLSDIKPELELINTDIINCLNSKTDAILSEIPKIKQMLKAISTRTVGASVKSDLDEIQNSISEIMPNSVLDDVYIKLSNELNASETNIRDFLLRDIDTVILKIDELKNELDLSFEKYVPPSASEFDELNKFAKDIENFKQQNKELIEKSAEDIKSSISDKITETGEELKSILAISANNKEIIDAIDELKDFISNSSNIRSSVDYDGDTEDDGFGTNIYDRPFEKNLYSEDVVEELKSEFERVGDELSNLTDKNTQVEQVLNLIKEKITDNTIEDEKFDISTALDCLKEDVKNLHREIQTGSEPNFDWLNELKSYIVDCDMKSMLDVIDKKIDIIASSNNTSDLEDIKYSLDSIEEKLENSLLADNIGKLSKSDAQITSMLEILNNKIDIIAADNDTDTQYMIEDVRDLILEQKDCIENLDKNNKTEAFEKCLDELTKEVNNINNDSTEEIQKSLKEMKESIMTAVVTIFDQVSFIEESEDIKDFVEEKTDEINRSLGEVTDRLKQITNAGSDEDYTYSMQDIESDLAKLRIALNQMQASENEAHETTVSSILDNIHQISSTVENLHNVISKDDSLTDLKTQLNFIAASSDESYNAIGKMLTGQLAYKVDRVAKLLEHSNDSDKVMRQALIYMGEWIDSASEKMNNIVSNSVEIPDVKKAIDDLKLTIPHHTDILNSIEEKFEEQQHRLAYFEKQISKIENFETQFEMQQQRIDRLEASLDKVLSVVEGLDDSKVTRKIDKIDKQIARLSENIEKLASYVD